MLRIQNTYLSCDFEEKGAEWKTFIRRSDGSNFLWNSDPRFWGKSAPILFPIVGSLKNGRYAHQGVEYQLPRHGFARDRAFMAQDVSADSVSFVLVSDASTRQVFPWDWSLVVRYELHDWSLRTLYKVENTGTERMYFSIGAHPAFSVPFPGGAKSFTDYRIEFQGDRTLSRELLDKEGLRSGVMEAVELDDGFLPLSRELFSRDALVFKGLRSTVLRLASQSSLTSIDMKFEGFDHFGIWSAPGADFVCLEPWCGVADAALGSATFAGKEGIQTLEAGASFQRSFDVTLVC